MSGRRVNYSEVDELNRILTVERELVLRTQENYRTLKQKYVELTKEHDFLKNEHEKLAEGRENREKLAELESRSDELIRNMKKANEEREVRYEKFKVDTIEELQNVYRKELQDQNQQIEKLRLDRAELVKENDELLEEISNLHTNFDDQKRKEKAREVEIRTQFDRKLKEIVMSNENSVSPRFEYYERQIEELRIQIQKKEEDSLKKSQKFSDIISEKNRQMEEFKNNEEQLKHQISNLESVIRSLKLQLLDNSAETELHNQIDQLKTKTEIFLKERLDLELKMRQEQREFSKKSSEIEEKLTVRIAEFEKICDLKDRTIEELKNQVEKAENLSEELQKSEQNRQIEEENRERLEAEVKDLYTKLQKNSDDRQNFEMNLKIERDRLEVSLATLRKQLESTPEAPQNVEKLRKELRESERRRLSDREKHQNIVSEFTSALKTIEKRQRITQEKLREKMADNFI